jgi:DMSO/TMAO reductase YedYZ molybdopterin-dependent catalytic subunit
MKNIIFILLLLIVLNGCSVDEGKIPASTPPEVINEKIEEEDVVEIDEDSVDNKVVDNEEQHSVINVDEPIKSEGISQNNEAASNVAEDNQKITDENEVVEEQSSVEIEEEPATSGYLLKISGLTDNELSLSLEELKAMDELIFEADFYSLNSFGTTGYTHFKGINLWGLLEKKALIKNEASVVTVVAQDGYKIQFTVEQVKKQDYIDETNAETKYPMIVAWEENGEEYSQDKGAPFKLVVGQKEAGDINKPQWVSNIDSIVVE